ncbi:MAG: hypothetical protein Q9175_007162 [Cornicularia normoerica]
MLDPYLATDSIALASTALYAAAPVRLSVTLSLHLAYFLHITLPKAQPPRPEVKDVWIAVYEASRARFIYVRSTE